MLPPETTLDAAQTWLAARMADGARCPCCGQLAKIYRRQINAAMVTALVNLYVATHDGSYAHWPSILRTASLRGGDNVKLRYWGLVEEEPALSATRTGHWRITADGVAFLQRRLRVPRYAEVYDGTLLKLTGPEVDVEDCIGRPFDYRELMDA